MQLGKQHMLTLVAALTSIMRNEQRRWIIVSANNKQTTDVYRRLSKMLTQLVASLETKKHEPAKVAQFRRLAGVFQQATSDFDLLRSHIVCASPYVGFASQRLCLRVLRVFIIRYLPQRNDEITEACCKEFSLSNSNDNQSSGLVTDLNAPSNEVIALNNPLLLFQLEPCGGAGDANTTQIDHRVCCHTWDANVIHVAQHPDLFSQSFCAARDALPSNSTLSPVVFMGEDYRYPDLYNALVRASPCVAERLMLIDCNTGSVPQKMLAAYPKPRTFLADLVAETSGV
jgi:hypothetical protein